MGYFVLFLLVTSNQEGGQNKGVWNGYYTFAFASRIFCVFLKKNIQQNVGAYLLCVCEPPTLSFLFEVQHEVKAERH